MKTLVINAPAVQVRHEVRKISEDARVVSVGRLTAVQAEELEHMDDGAIWDLAKAHRVPLVKIVERGPL